MFTKSVAAMAVLALMAPNLGAQSVSIGPQLGYHKTSDVEKGNFMFGAAMRLKLGSALGVEGSINYRQEDFVDDTGTIRSWPIMVTGMFYPLPVVYGAVGAGWYNTTLDFDSDLIENQTSRDVGWHFGGGLEVPLQSNVKLTGDIRYVFLDYNFDDVPFSDVNSNFYVITAGLLFGL